jgi:hypothetical protein
VTFPDGTGGPPPADDPPTTRLKPIGPDTRPFGTYGSAAPGAYGTAAGTGNGTGTGTGTLTGVATAAAFGPPPAGGARRRRGLRTALLLAAAVLAGTLGGVTYGYAEQAGEPPSPLPPLNQPGLAHPEKPLPADEAPEPLSAAQDRRVKTDGDLRKLLVSRPAGAVDAELGYGEEGWLAPYELAADTGAPEEMLSYVLEHGLRRTAFTSWSEQDSSATGTVILIYLFQFRNDATAGSVDYLESEQVATVVGAGGDVRSVPLAGSADGRAYFPGEPYEEAGLPPVYQAIAIARRGDIVMEVHQMDSSPIEEADLTKLAERQLERL